LIRGLSALVSVEEDEEEEQQIIITDSYSLLTLLIGTLGLSMAEDFGCHGDGCVLVGWGVGGWGK
jgi:hypothetical protein